MNLKEIINYINVFFEKHKKKIFKIVILFYLVFYFFGIRFVFAILFDYFNISFIKPMILNIILIFILFLIYFLQNKYSFKLTHFLFNLIWTFFIYFFYMIFILLFFHFLNILFNLNNIEPLLGIIAILSSLIVIIISLINGNKVKIKEIDIFTNKINQNLKIVVIADNHIFGKYSKKRFEKSFKKILKIKSDYVVIVGDLFDIPGKIPLDVLEITKKYSKPILFVYGNHDLIYGKEKVRYILKNTYIKILENNNYLNLEQNINFIGVNYNDKKEYLKSFFNNSNISSNNYNILLYHEPKDILIAEKNRIDLMISGHTHAGQVFPLTYFMKFIYPYNYGLYNIKNMKLYVNPGTDVWGSKLRFKSYNEITLINLIKK